MRLVHLSSFLCIACFALCACTSTEKPTSPAPASSPSSTASVNSAIYRNDALGFSIELPATWYAPGTSDTDPHFYESKACSEQDRITCDAFEVQNQDSEFAEGPDAVLKAGVSAGLKPERLTALIPEAIVIESPPDGPAEGWYYEYHIFFSREKREFLIFSNDRKLESSIFPTMKLIK